MTEEEAYAEMEREEAAESTAGQGMSPAEFEQEVEKRTSDGRVQVGVSARDKILAEATRGLAQTVGVDSGEKTEFYGLGLKEIAYRFVRAADQKVKSQENSAQVIGRALTTTDFPKVLANVANKSLFEGFDQAPETWSTWCTSGTVLDFKDARILKVSALAALDEVPEATEYKYGGREEESETVKVVTYGKLFAITRQAIINDDLSVLTDLPFAHGEVAARKIGDLAYATLTGNPSMGDGVDLFHADHSNLMTGGIVGTTTIAEGIKLMKQQKDISENRRLNIRPMFFIAPTAIEGAAEVFFRSERFDSTAKDATRVNPYSGNYFTRVYDTRLDDSSELVWYLAAARGKTVKLFFLGGNDQPYLEARPGWSVDGLEYKVRIDCAAKALDWRGLSRNAGE